MGERLTELSRAPWASVTFSGAKVVYEIEAPITQGELDDVEVEIPSAVLADLTWLGEHKIEAFVIDHPAADYDEVRDALRAAISKARHPLMKGVDRG